MQVLQEIGFPPTSWLTGEGTWTEHPEEVLLLSLQDGEGDGGGSHGPGGERVGEGGEVLPDTIDALSREAAQEPKPPSGQTQREVKGRQAGCCRVIGKAKGENP